MSSGVWGPGGTPGDGSPSGRGTSGDAAPARTGTARPLIAWASGLLAVLCVVCALVVMRANGLLLLAAGFTVLCAWAVGMLSPSWWVAVEDFDSAGADVDRVARR